MTTIFGNEFCAPHFIWQYHVLKAPGLPDFTLETMIDVNRDIVIHMQITFNCHANYLDIVVFEIRCIVLH